MYKYYKNISSKKIPIFDGKKLRWIKPGQSKELPKCIDVIHYEKAGMLRRDKTKKDMPVIIKSKIEEKIEQPKKIEKKKKSKK